MKNCIKFSSFLILLIASLGQCGNFVSFHRGILSEIMDVITNGAVEHFIGCPMKVTFNKDDIAYYLFTRSNKNRTQLTLNNLFDLDETKDTKIILGGWTQNTHDPIMLNLVQAYLIRYDCNVIFVEYVNLTRTEYTEAYCNSIKGAEVMGDFFCDVYYEGYLDFNKVHMIGLSLGGQVIGLIGQRVQETCNQKVDRMTGLDPAGPIYQNQDISKRLDRSDANFVDVIHTNMGMFGYHGTMGHVDFFPNCGTVQPGCMHINGISKIVSTIISTINCSHKRSVVLFIESVYGQVFNSTSCTLCSESRGFGKCLSANDGQGHTIMGEDCPRDPPAYKFYVKTNSESPFTIVY